MEMLLTIEQTAQRLQLHPETIRRQLVSGTLRGIKRGRSWRVPESALAEAKPENVISREEAKRIGYGFLKGRIRSSDEFLAAKHAETKRDEAQHRAKVTV